MGKLPSPPGQKTLQTSMTYVSNGQRIKKQKNMHSRFIREPVAVLPPGSVVIAFVRDGGMRSPKPDRKEQRRILTAYCQEHALILGRAYFEPVGGLNGKRNRFLEMLDDISGCAKDAYPRGLLVLSYVRLSREDVELNLFVNMLMDGVIITYSLNEKIVSPQ